jgi:hypothetical protein
MAQTAVCNRHHNVNQQFCRWLLLALDRLPSNTLKTTQEMIANMLGVRREGVTAAAGKLQKLGVIKYSRGEITVLDRSRLEQLSCECYALVKAETEQLPLAAVFLAGLVLVSCATMPPETSRSVRGAQQAIANAERVEASRYAAGELGAARSRLASAETAAGEKKMVLADQFADESRAEAELASARTAEAKASAVNDEMKRSTGTLVEEMKRGTGDKP